MFLLQLFLIQLVPLSFIVALAGYQLWQRKRNRVRLPVKDKLLRPPGESLRVKLEELDDRSGLLVAIMMVIPIATFLVPHIHWAIPLLATALVSGGLSLFVVREWTLRIDYRLGFQGERAVAEELNQLMRKGCSVFHDLQMPSKANIDHVVVAATGVFVVETKTRRKRKSRNDMEDYKIIYNGQVLQFPQSTETKPLEQVERNAGWLSEQLSKALAEPIRVTPILTFPGWWIERTGRGKVNVVHHKEIGQVISSGLGAPLNEKQMKQVSAWLEDRCRNVEF